MEPHLLLLVLQQLLVLEVLELLELLELVLLLQAYGLALLRVAPQPALVPLPPRRTHPPAARHHVGAGRRGGHARGLVADWLPGV